MSECPILFPKSWLFQRSESDQSNCPNPGDPIQVLKFCLQGYYVPRTLKEKTFKEYKTNKIVLYLPILFIGLALASKSPKSRNKKINFILFGQSLSSDWPMKRIITFYIPWIQSPKTKQFCSLKTIKYWKIFGILELN